MKKLLRHIGVRNPVWIVPLAIPIVLHGTQSFDRAILFSVVIAIVVPVTHALSFFVERSFPRSLTFLPLLTIAAVVLTLVEVVIGVSGIAAGPRTTALIRSLAVSGLLLYPTFSGTPSERFYDRMQRVGSVTIAFLLGFALFYAVRMVASIVFGSLAFTVAGGFFVLALGRMTVTLIHDLRRSVRGGGS